MEHLACYRGESLKLGFASCQQLEVEGLEMRIEARRGECRHEERLAQIAIALPADARRFVHRSTGSLMGGIEAAVSDPLAHRHLLVQASQLGQDLHRADLPDSRYGQQVQPFAMGL